MADSRLYYVYDFDIYCGQYGIHENIALVRRSELLVVHNIVMKLMEGNQRKGHYIVLNNHFTSVGLFEELL